MTSTFPPQSDDALPMPPLTLLAVDPEDTPARLRGETFHCALRSGPSVGWNLNSCKELQLGAVPAVGGGLRDFGNKELPLQTRPSRNIHQDLPPAVSLQ